jgi:hypothetical protein
VKKSTLPILRKWVFNGLSCELHAKNRFFSHVTGTFSRCAPAQPDSSQEARRAESMWPTAKAVGLRAIQGCKPRKWAKDFCDYGKSFIHPGRGLIRLPQFLPWLAPWATVCRRAAAPAVPASASPASAIMRGVIFTTKVFSANGKLSLISLSQLRGALHSLSRIPLASTPHKP